MSRTTVSRIVAILLSLTLLAWEARAQIQPGGAGGGSSSGPTKDSFGTAFPSSGFGSGAVDQHGSMASLTLSNAGNLNVNIAEGGGAGGTSSNFVANMPTAGTAAGFKGPGGRMASASVDNSDRLLVTIGSPTTANQGASAAATNLWPVALTTNADTLVRPGDAANNALRVNIVAGGSTNSTLGTAMPSTGIVAGFKDPLGSLASATVDNAGRQFVVIGSPTTANAGASATVANTWSTNVLTDSGTPVRPGDDTNKAVRVNIVAGQNPGGTSSNFGTAFPTAGTAAGFRSANGGMASASTTNLNSLIVVPQTVDGAALNGVTEVSYNTAMPSAGTPMVVRTPAGLAASASLTNNNALLVEQVDATRRCDQSASISTSNAGNWQLAASASGQNVYVCGYTVIANTTPVAIKFVSGQTATDKPCSGNSLDLTGAMPMAASGGMVNSVSAVPIFSTSANHGLCINLSNGGQVSGHITYTRR